MSFEQFHSSDSIERNGDIISGADYESLESVLPDVPMDDEIVSRAVAVADQIITSYGTPSGLEALSAIRNVEDEPSEVTKRYDVAWDKAEALIDKGIDSKVAWYQIDPTGEIRHSNEVQDAQRQASLNHLMAEQMRKTVRDAKFAEIEQIVNPVERERATARLLAEERIAERRRTRRS